MPTLARLSHTIRHSRGRCLTSEALRSAGNDSIGRQHLADLIAGCSRPHIIEILGLDRIVDGHRTTLRLPAEPLQAAAQVLLTGPVHRRGPARALLELVDNTETLSQLLRLLTAELVPAQYMRALMRNTYCTVAVLQQAPAWHVFDCAHLFQYTEQWYAPDYGAHERTFHDELAATYGRELALLALQLAPYSPRARTLGEWMSDLHRCYRTGSPAAVAALVRARCGPADADIPEHRPVTATATTRTPAAPTGIAQDQAALAAVREVCAEPAAVIETAATLITGGMPAQEALSAAQLLCR